MNMSDADLIRYVVAKELIKQPDSPKEKPEGVINAFERALNIYSETEGVVVYKDKKANYTNGGRDIKKTRKYTKRYAANNHAK